VTYYDFRNNTPAAGLTTDYWLAHAGGNVTNPASWAADETRLTSLADGVTGAPFDMENAAPTSRGYFLGDYMGLSAAGNSFYALFAEAGSASNPSDIWFRDPPPAAVTIPGDTAAVPAGVAPPTFGVPVFGSAPAPSEAVAGVFLPPNGESPVAGSGADPVAGADRISTSRPAGLVDPGTTPAADARAVPAPSLREPEGPTLSPSAVAEDAPGIWVG
jgi:hypothetical protein